MNISISTILGWGLTLALAASGIFFSQNSSTSAKVEDVKVSNVATIERVAKLEEAVVTIKEDSREIKADIRTILNKLK